ncbi:Tripartite-type tricarboxylate transporter, receptor component TctC [Paracoccus halophilus]|uniref:Tripartite-type tricarboxylate transporter, receptor component TctC n=1 Tax=Paracoccus halophilus TaxID=376733 RepID=A0A099EZP4_9RHOB|nr:tripartite tricarboxylate transporter substrate binding protein [Paracoccus halophilus]KGJ03689.1 hypothetical protein IT41_12945 [Paracoccus halophilus]SFA57215.1 Tripartite-type tricarboxylate transporter, receptor component TctC [Paracoccus halophilus]
MKAGLLGIVGAMTMAVSAPMARAEYPERPITMIIPYGAGGTTDLSARTISEPLGKAVGQPLVMSNIAGAGGATGTVAVKNASADGYTMLFGRVGPHSVSPAMKAMLPYTLDDLRFVAVYEINPIVCVVDPKSGIQTVEDLVARVGEGGVTYSSSGVGSLQQIAAVMVLREFGVEDPVGAATHIPQKSDGEAATSVLNGTATFLCTNSSPLAGFVKAGQLHPLLTTSEERLEGFDAPSATELEKPALTRLVGWTGIAGPADLPDELVAQWSGWLATATEDPRFRQRMEASGSIIELMSPEDSDSFIRGQYEAIRALVDELGMRIEG